MRAQVNLKCRLLITLGASLCAAGSSAASAQTISLRYGQAYSAMRSIFSLPVSVAQREGFFRREGLNFRNQELC